MFEAEVKFYDELGEATGTGLPNIYFASINSGTAEFVIVMEDLCNLTMVDQTAGMSERQALAAVRILAKIHAMGATTNVRIIFQNIIASNSIFTKPYKTNILRITYL